jgi:hypothetical protein
MRIEKLLLLVAWAACIGKVSGRAKQINSKRFQRRLPELNYHERTESVRRRDMVIDLLRAGKSKDGNKSNKASDVDSTIAPKYAVAQKTSTSTKAPTAYQRKGKGKGKGDRTVAPSGTAASRPSKGSTYISQDSEDIPILDSRPSKGSISYDSEDIPIGKGTTSKRSKQEKKKKSKLPKSKLDSKKSKKSSNDTSPPNLSPVLPPSADGKF